MLASFSFLRETHSSLNFHLPFSLVGPILALFMIIHTRFPVLLDSSSFLLFLLLIAKVATLATRLAHVGILVAFILELGPYRTSNVTVFAAILFARNRTLLLHVRLHISYKQNRKPFSLLL
jgi:hypothetical protein